MGLTSARFNEVWPSSTPTQTAVSARVAHVVNRDTLSTDVHTMLNELQQEMTHRTHMFLIVLIVITVVFMQRIGRLEQRLMIHSMGVSSPRHWW